MNNRFNYKVSLFPRKLPFLIARIALNFAPIIELTFINRVQCPEQFKEIVLIQDVGETYYTDYGPQINNLVVASVSGTLTIGY